MVRKKKRLLCVCSCVLGNRTFTSQLQESLGNIPLVDTDYIFIEPKDYSVYPAPRWRRVSMTAEALWVIKQKLKNVDLSSYDLVIAQGFEIAWALRRRVGSIPCIMFNDATPTISHYLLLNYRHEMIWKIRSYLFIVIYKYIFRHIFSHLSYCFPRTSWCAESLIEDFGIDPKKIRVCPPNLDLDLWKPAECEKKDFDKVRLLFVGNDFERKGGYQLLEIFKELSHKSELFIVSNDPQLDEMILPAGVKHFKNIPHDELPLIFQQSDIFVFPTLKEHLGLVQTEAIACGLPIISRDVGGIKDIVKDGYNGFLMPYESTEEQWVEKIKYLIDHPEARTRLGANSRKLAEELFSMEKFEGIVKSAIDSVLKEKF